MKTSTPHRTLRHAAALACTGAALAFAAGSASAGQLIYTPVNPSFGGNPLNGSFLMSVATQANQRNATNPLDGLASSLDFTGLENSLNELSGKIDKLCGTGTTCAGTGTTPAPASAPTAAAARFDTGTIQ